MSNDKAVDQMVKFVFWKLHKPGRLATPAAVKDARYAAQDILRFGYGPLQVMEIFTFLDDNPEINPRTGFDESFGWWKALINDLPSLATVLQKPKFISQYEARSAEMRKFRDAKGYSEQDWVDNMIAPRPEDKNYEERKKRMAQQRFNRYLESQPTKLPKELADGVYKNKTIRDKCWNALVASYANPEQLYDFLRAEMTSDGVAYVEKEGNDPLRTARVAVAGRICECETILPYKDRIFAQTFTSESEIQAQKEICSFRSIVLKIQEIAEKQGMSQDDGNWYDETGKPTGAYSLRLN
jgi:hypothetical protein